MTDLRQIKTPEYATSRERMSELYHIAIEGQEAEAVIKYADIFIAETSEALLEAVKNGKNYEQAALEYKVACKFMERLKFAVNQGKQKQETYERLKTQISPF